MATAQKSAKTATTKTTTTTKAATKSNTKTTKAAPKKTTSAPKTTTTTVNTTSTHGKKNTGMSGAQVLMILIVIFITFMLGFYIGEISMKNKIARSLTQALNALGTNMEQNIQDATATGGVRLGN